MGEQFADEDKKGRNVWMPKMRSMGTFTRCGPRQKVLATTRDSVRKWILMKRRRFLALKDGQSWLDSNPEADAEEIKEKHKEIEGICAPIVSKYYGGGAGGAGGGDEEEEDEAHDEL